ncbi:PREDICTED: uncharacterized protein LOC106742846 isoform X2 [Dinoponera quadriceps]|nr:PREDICTED: uncharacterized protein LOC106742846 isoform X2 [Dinoponera quadriceps]
MDCNKRESLKLSELSNFEPRNEVLYSVEVKVFKEYLEKKYPLCDTCKSTVWNVLNKQTLWLTRYKMLFFRQKPVKTVISNARKFDTIFRLISIVFGSVITYNHDVIWLPFGGLFFHLCACWASSMRKKIADVLSIILWCCMTAFVSVVNLTTLQNVWLTAEHVTQYYMIAACALLISFLNVAPGSRKNTSATSVSFKKLKLHTRDAVASPQFPCDGRSQNNGVFNETNSSVESSSSIGELSTAEIKSHLAVPQKQKLSTTAAGVSDPSYLSPSSSCKNDSPYSHYLDSNVSVLSALSLSEDSSRYSLRTPPIFERRIYGASTCDLFRRSAVAASGRPRCILSPPKLRSVTQTSWVAGGYWQEGVMSGGAPTLSRSSSQSSGFGSAGSSNFAPSREPSVHEFDRCSVVSDVTQFCYTSRANITSPAKSFASSSAPRAHSRCSMYDAPTRNCSPAIRVCGGAIVAESPAQQEQVTAANAVRNESVPVCPSHSTVITSPGLLFALFCGSLVLNMIVLCAMLLR